MNTRRPYSANALRRRVAAVVTTPAAAILLALLLAACGGGSGAAHTQAPGTVAADGCAAGTPDTSLCATLAAIHDDGVDCITHPGTPCPTRRPRTPVPSPTRFDSATPLGTIVDCNPGFVWDGQACVVPPTAAPAATATACPTGNGTPVSACDADATSGVEGRVLVGPTCPVERPDSPCAYRPAQVYIWADPASPTTTVRSDADGRFRLPLPPGIYEINAGTCAPWMRCVAAPYPRILSRNVTVRASAFTEVTLYGDTGIR